MHLSEWTDGQAKRTMTTALATHKKSFGRDLGLDLLIVWLIRRVDATLEPGGLNFFAMSQPCLDLTGCNPALLSRPEFLSEATRENTEKLSPRFVARIVASAPSTPRAVQYRTRWLLGNPHWFDSPFRLTGLFAKNSSLGPPSPGYFQETL